MAPLEDARLPFASLPNLKLYYEVHGAGQPLVLLAGITLDSSYWQQYLPLLSQHYQVIILDNRHVGKTESSLERYSVGDTADDVAHLLDFLSIKRCHLLGFSMGGFTAASLAARYPHLVQSLILVATAGRPPVRAQRVIQTWVQLAAILPPELMFREQAPWVLSKSLLANAELYEQAMQEYLKTVGNQTADQFGLQAAACNGWDFFQEKGEIVAPSLILCGADDILIGPEDSQLLAGAITGAQLEIIPEAAHELLFEQPDLCQKIILSFLANHAR